MNIVAAALGRYDTRVPFSDFDCVIANSFGTSARDDSVNAEIMNYADKASSSGEGCPLIVDETLTYTLESAEAVIYHVVKGPVSSMAGAGTGTWGVLKSAHAYMKRREPGLYTSTRPLRPLIVGQHYHVGRIAMQTRALGMDPQVPIGLPRSFDRHSSQIWTRNLALWLPREILGSVVLRKKGQL